jgi:N-acetylmuramoyl-L-alanine amidase
VRLAPVLAAPLTLLLLAGCSSAAAHQQALVTPAAPSTSTHSVAAPPSPTSTPTRHHRRPAATTPSETHPAVGRSTTAPARGSLPTLPPVPAGLTVVLNPGHNGGNGSHTSAINRQVPAGYGQYKACDTTGTNTNAGYSEHAFNWDLALRVRAILQSHGVHVIMTRPNDNGVGPCVDQRAAIGNRRGVDAVISIHADGAPSSGHGFHVNQDSRRPDGATAADARASIALGRAVHAALVRSSGLVPSTYIGQDGYYYRDDLAGLNLSTNPATFLELGNMRNSGDAALQSSPAGRERIARAVAAGILAYLSQR